MRKIYILIFTNILLLYINTTAQVYKTQPFSPEIHTIQINKNGDWQSYPVIDLSKDEFVSVNFDRISEYSDNRLRYKLIHCNADWKPSSVHEIDYIDGFNDNLIEDYAFSVNTTIEYTNFRFDIPNNDIRPMYSGNYAVVVYEEDNPQNILLSACFSIVDAQVAVNATISSNTLIDVNQEHQQVSFTVDHSSVRIVDPYSDIKVFVRQNGRLDNQKAYIKPTNIQASKLVYDYSRELIFEAGNEYRRFEAVSHRYNGLRIIHTEYKRPYYYSYLIPDIFRSGKRYIYDQDQDGMFYIRNSEGNDSDIDADYFHIQFRLQAQDPLIENIWVNGNFTNNIFDEKYQMQYDYAKNEYYLSLLLKQGAYNYQYLTEVKNGVFSTGPVEGNYFETQNRYQIYIYHRPPGARYDSLIGYLNIGN